MLHAASHWLTLSGNGLFNFGFAASGALEAGQLRGHTAALVDELYGRCSLDADVRDWRAAKAGEAEVGATWRCTSSARGERRGEAK